MNRGQALFVLAIILAAALAAGGVTSTSGTSSSSSGFSFFSFSKAPSRTYNSETESVDSKVARIKTELEKNKAAAEASPLSGDITLTSGGTSSSKPEQEYVTISLNSRHVGKVLITGFKLESAITGQGTTIGEGVELPFAGQLNEDYPIFLSPGDKAIIVTGRSPMGYSFRLNICTGYFAQFQTYTPSLPRQCPTPRDEVDRYLGRVTDACYDYLGGISTCTMPLQNIPLAYVDSECRNFATEKLNYKTCAETHKNDPTFYKKEWRIFLGRSEKLWKARRETIKLYDLNGKTVSTLTY